MRPFSLAVIILLANLLCTHTNSQEIGFIETFALSQDRSSALSELVPGTEDYYYYHCLHYQNTEQLDKVDKLLTPWIKRFGNTNRVQIIRNRQALLNFDRDPEGTYKYFQSALKLKFNHQREIPQAQRDLPTRLDTNLINTERLLKSALSRKKDTGQIENTGLELLAREALDKTRRRHLLTRIRHPDFPNLVSLVVADLKERDSRGFGSSPIHFFRGCHVQVPLSFAYYCIRLPFGGGEKRLFYATF